MAPSQRVKAIQKEGRMTLAVNAINKNQMASDRRAADVYKVSKKTTYARLYGRPSRLGFRSKFRLLSEIEKDVLIS